MAERPAEPGERDRAIGPPRRLRLADESLLRERPFVLFWLARMVATAGATVGAVVLPILVFQITGSALQTSLLATLAVLPYLAFGLFAGAMADRVNRKRLMIGCHLVNAVAMASIPLAAELGILTVAQIYVVALVSATAFVWFDAANFGALPAIAGRERIVEANSIISSGSTALALLGPSIGGVLAATIGPAPVLALDAASYLVSACLLGINPVPFNAVAATAGAAGSAVRRTLRDIREGLDFLWRQPLVRTMVLTGFGNTVTGGAVMGLLVVYGVRALELGEGGAGIGLLYSAGAAGSLLATLALPWLVRHVPVGRITLWGLVANPLLVVALALAPGLTVALPFYLLWFGCHMLVIVNGISLRQMVTPDHLQARVNTAGRMVAWGGTPFGAALGGLVAELTTIRTAYALLALPVLVSALLGWYSPLRSERKDLVVPVEAGGQP
jgi:MFS family permease